MKKNVIVSLLFGFICALTGCIVNMLINGVNAADSNLIAALSISAITEYTQSPEQIIQIQAENAEYECIHPTPDNSPPPALRTWTETSYDGRSLIINTRKAATDIVVYCEETNVYHMGHCKLYEGKYGSDYSNPHWLGDVILNGTRCTECVTDDVYYTYIEAMYRTELYKKGKIKKLIYKVSVVVLDIFVVCIFGAAIYLYKKKRSAKYSGTAD